MKKLILIVLLSLLSFNSNSQSRIGYSIVDISREFFTGIIDYQDPYLSVSTDNAYVLYVFDFKDTCIAYFITPKSPQSLKSYLNEFNTNLNIVSPTFWIQEYNGYNIYIELETDSEGQPTFYCHRY